jgi:hypothetical protein
MRIKPNDRMKIEGLSIRLRLHTLHEALLLINITEPKFLLDYIHLRNIFMDTDGENIDDRNISDDEEITFTFLDKTGLPTYSVTRDASIEYEFFSIIHPKIEQDQILEIDELGNPLEIIAALELTE